MKEVIEKLVEIEDKAHRIVDNASTEKLRIEREKKDNLEKFKQELEEKNQKKLDELREKYDSEIGPEVDGIYKEGNKRLMEIENNFVANKDAMADEVFHRIIGA